MDRPSAPPAPAVAFLDVAWTPPGAAEMLRGVSFEVGPRETVVLVGRSGSGKTSTLKLVNRLLAPTSGEVRVAGRSTA